MFQFSGTLDINMADLGAKLKMEGTDLTLEADNPAEILRSMNIQKSKGLKTVRGLASELNRMGLTLTLVSKGSVVMVMGKNAQAGVATRMLRVPHLELRIGTEIAKLLIA